MAEEKEDIKYILDDYYRQHMEELSSSEAKDSKFRKIYNEFMVNRNGDDEEQQEKSLLHYINRLNKLAKRGAYYCGINLGDFANKIETLHSQPSPFNLCIFERTEDGISVIRQYNKEKGEFELIPIEHNLYSVFKAFVQRYIDLKLLDLNYISENNSFSWNNLVFCDGYIEIRDQERILITTHKISTSRGVFNGIKAYFQLQFPDFVISIIGGKVIINDEQRFLKLMHSVNTSDYSSFLPCYVATPKNDIFSYFKETSIQDTKKRILQLKQKFLTYLCSLHLDRFKIQYTLEWRVNYANDFEYIENAFLFTISETNYYIYVVYENTEDSRSSIVFYVRPDQYDLAIKNICGYFSSREYNKRETLASNYVDFKNVGIEKYKRIYHTDYNQWKKTIDSFHRK